MNKFIFLDVDGVLNDERARHPNGAHGMDWACVQRLNRIIEQTDPLIVVSSSWRKLVLDGHMTLVGLEKTLMSHGVDCQYRLVGTTEPGYNAISRGQLISRWLTMHARHRYRYVILDDGAYWIMGQDDHGIITAGHKDHFVHTDFRTGLTDQDVEAAIAILNKDRMPGKRKTVPYT